MILFTIPTESIFRSQDALYVIWVMTATGMLVLITCYERCIRRADD